MLTRRRFLEYGSAVAAASSAAPLLASASTPYATAAPDYRALVCIELGGGADSFNMLVPSDTEQFRQYAARRGNLALSRDRLLPLPGTDDEGRRYSVNSELLELSKLFSIGDLAFVANVGPLPKRPNRSVRPPEMDLSHTGLISRWQRGTADTRSITGWAGRVADVFAESCATSRVPVNISASGMNLMQLGHCSLPASTASSSFRNRNGLPIGVDFAYINTQLAEQAIDTGRPGPVRRRKMRLRKIETETKAVLNDALPRVSAIRARFEPDEFSASLAQVARIIAARRLLGARRQIFFVHFDGWDQHHDLLKSQDILLPMFSRGLAAFRDALLEIGALEDVTAFTTSEFGRALESNGNGSDHGWGSHHVVMGGAVRGGAVFGRFPELSAKNPADIGGGCFVPTISTDEYFAELALWLGVPASEMSYVLPDLHRSWSATDGTAPLGMFG